MPFTPYHLGPAALIKAVAGHRFSFMIFGYSQVLIDLEPLIRLLRGEGPVHGLSHSYAGALVIAAVAALTGRPLFTALFAGWNAVFRTAALRVRGTISSRTAWLSAFIGTISHVAIDSIMHRDMHPLVPFSGANHLLRVISVPSLHDVLVAAGVVGGVTLAAMWAWRSVAPGWRRQTVSPVTQASMRGPGATRVMPLIAAGFITQWAVGLGLGMFAPLARAEFTGTLPQRAIAAAGKDTTPERPFFFGHGWRGVGVRVVTWTSSWPDREAYLADQAESAASLVLGSSADIYFGTIDVYGESGVPFRGNGSSFPMHMGTSSTKAFVWRNTGILRDNGRWWGDAGFASARPRLIPSLANTAVYALMLHAVLVAAARARFVWRRRAARCGACGFPVTGSPRCPECGTSTT